MILGGNEADVQSLAKLEAWIFKAEPDADVTATPRDRLPLLPQGIDCRCFTQATEQKRNRSDKMRQQKNYFD